MGLGISGDRGGQRMKYIVTDKGPIDRRQPGADVTGIYDAATLERLVEEGYIAAETPRPKRKATAKGAADGN